MKVSELVELCSEVRHGGGCAALHMAAVCALELERNRHFRVHQSVIMHLFDMLRRSRSSFQHGYAHAAIAPERKLPIGVLGCFGMAARVAGRLPQQLFCKCPCL